MSHNPQPSNEANILGKFASAVGLLGASLYFTGWIYRWAYFGFFQLEVTTLDLPVESFLLVPLQVLLGNGWAMCKSAIAAILAAILIPLTLWLIESLSNFVSKILNHWRSQLMRRAHKRNRAKLVRQLQHLPRFNRIKFRETLVDEIVIVAWVLIILFYLARLQGFADARRDAVNNSSFLPVVTLITPENRLAVGRKLDDVLTLPSLKGYRIIGNKGLFDNLRGLETNDTTDPKKPRVWRLLMERGGWIYLFPALPPNAAKSDRPPVLAIQESEMGEQLMILSPEASK